MPDLVAIFSDPANFATLATLIAMEIVLGIDNLIFISVLTNKLPEHQRQRRAWWASAQLSFSGWQLTDPVVTVFGHSFSWRDMKNSVTSQRDNSGEVPRPSGLDDSSGFTRAHGTSGLASG